MDGSIADSSGVTVESGTLTGSGVVPAVTSGSGGAVAPGTASGTATLSSGDLSLATGSAFNVELDGTTAGSGYDQLDVTGSVNLNSDSLGGATLNVTFAEGYTPQIGDSFTILTSEGTPILGTFNGLPDKSVMVIGGQNLEITYSANAIVLTDLATPTIAVTATPPSSSQFGQSVAFGVTVTGGGPTPTGTVTFYDGDPNSGGVQIGETQTLSSGQASVSTGALSIGTHQIYVSYSGDPYYIAQTQQLSGGQDVTQDVTTTSVSSASSTTTYGAEAIFTALVAQDFGGTPTGIVEFFDGGNEIGTGTLNTVGVATFTTTALSATASPHSITASYEGSLTSQSSGPSASYLQTINPAALTITAASFSKTYGQTTTFAGTEFTTSGLVNGDTVNFVTLSSPGAAATADVVGSPYTISASTALGTGLDNYIITYAPGQLTVNPAALTITANSTSKTYGDTTTFAGTEFSEAAWSTATRSPRSR